jgi:ketosteroid isomerase-like protein
MSQENMQIARRTFAAFNRTFAEAATDFYEMLDPKVEWAPVSTLLDGTHYQGHDGVREWFEEMKRDWTNYELRPEQFRDLGNDRVLVLGSWRAQGRAGNVLLDFPHAAWLMQYRNGKLLRLQTFTERKKALNAAGLQE